MEFTFTISLSGNKEKRNYTVENSSTMKYSLDQMKYKVFIDNTEVCSSDSLRLPLALNNSNEEGAYPADR